MNSSLLELHEALNDGFYIDNSTEKIDIAKSSGIQVNHQSGSISMSGRTGFMAMINDRTVIYRLMSSSGCWHFVFS